MHARCVRRIHRFRAHCRASKAAGRVMPRVTRQAAPLVMWARQPEIGPFGVPNRGARLEPRP